MKQWINGKKVQNWHKPLGKDELSQRYRKTKDLDAEYDSNGKPHSNSSFYMELCDEYWDYDCNKNRNSADIQCTSCQCKLTDFKKDFEQYKFYEYLDNLSFESDLESKLKGLTQLQTASSLQKTAKFQPHDSFAQTLHHYIELIHDGKYLELKDIVQSVAPSVTDIEILRKAYSDKKEGEFLRLVILFSPFWIRKPHTWEPTQGIDLLNHLFVRYEVPQFLYAQWEQYLRHSNLKWICWFILLGQGQSLNRAAVHFNWNISKKFAHYLQFVPKRTLPHRASMHAEILRLGGSQTDARRFSQNLALNTDLTNNKVNPTFRVFWYATALWLIKHSNDLTDQQSQHILLWAMHRYTELERNGQEFSWKGRSLPRTLAHSLAYQEEQKRPFSKYTWPAKGWDHMFKCAEGNIWEFDELITGIQLYEEGQAMMHCVSGYAPQCARGSSAIFSAKKDGERCLTIEINPQSKYLIQVKGEQNRAASYYERQAVKEWLEMLPVAINADWF